MDPIPLISPMCPTCHTEVRPTDYFCFNCGKNLRPAPPDTSIMSQLSVYAVSFFIPPMGIVYGIRYFKSPSTETGRIVGIIAVVLTVLSAGMATVASIQFINMINTTVNSQVQNIIGM